MKLYSKPGACSTAGHIALQWTGQPFEVEVMTRETLKSPAFLQVNPAGSVPAMVDGAFTLTQNAAILGYIADSYPAARLGGDGSAQQRAEATRWLAFSNSDLHPAFVPLFNPGAFQADATQHEAIKDAARKRVRGIFEKADRQLDGKQWLAGFRSFADPYLYITLRWAEALAIDLRDLVHLAAFKRRMEADAGVKAALAAEGLA